MRLDGPTAILAVCILSLLPAAAHTTTSQPVESFLPQKAITTASYVEIEQDPAFDEFTRRMVEYMESDREWYEQYARENQTDWEARIPWPERFGVSCRASIGGATSARPTRRSARHPVSSRWSSGRFAS